MKKPEIATQIMSSCLMGRTRYLSRVLTSIYDEEVRPFGVQASQVTCLAVIAARGPIRRSDIGRWLHFDSSTLTRNLRVMLSNQWIEEVVDDSDGRAHPLSVAAAGSELLCRLGPAWEKAQKKTLRLLGEDGRAAIVTLSNKLYDEA